MKNTIKKNIELEFSEITCFELITARPDESIKQDRYSSLNEAKKSLNYWLVQGYSFISLTEIKTVQAL